MAKRIHVKCFWQFLQRMASLKLFLVFWVIAFAKLEPAMSNRCQRDWVSFETNCYFFSTGKRNFKDAMVSCEKLGGELLELQNTLEEKWINLHGLIRGYKNGVWLGVTDLQKENNFSAISNGRDPYYINWAKGEPNNHSNKEHCAQHWVASKAWVDADCRRAAHFVCKK